jgi:DNA repair protein RadC
MPSDRNRDIVNSTRLKNWPKEERPRERLLAHGPSRLTDAELLAIVLRVGKGSFVAGKPGLNVSDLARTLLKSFRGLRGLDRAHTEDLLGVSGLGPAKVAQIKAAIELGKRVCAGRPAARAFASSTVVANYFRPRFVGSRHETAIAVYLNGQNRRLGEEDITEGTPTQATVYTRRILEGALRLSAAAIILVHNHTSGDPEPSEADDDTTRDLARACGLIQVLLVDHVIVGDVEHFSYAESGRLAEFQKG